MNKRINQTKPDKLWQKTSYSNLIRYVPSGRYFARIRVKGKLIVRSLKTDTLSVAKLRLSDLEKQERARPDSGGTRMTAGESAQIHLDRVQGNPGLKPRTKDYAQQRITALFKSWPELKNSDLRKVTKAQCLDWASRFGKESSPTAFNHTVSVLRHVFAIGVENGIRYDNPAMEIKRARERQKELTLPSPEQFAAFVTEMENGHGRFSRACADLVRFLAFGGFRKSEAAAIRWSDVDLVKGEIIVRGDAETGTKNWTTRRVPIIQDMRHLLDQLAEDGNPNPGEIVMAVLECQKAMDRAAGVVGMPRITHHDLRHLFATRCIESGVDIPTVSRWLGHKDGGALAMRVYGHLRDHHSSTMAARVTFSHPSPENVIPIEKEVAR